MKKNKPGLWQTLLGILALGTIALAWLIVIEIAVLITAMVIGLGTAIFSGWAVGFIAGALSYLVINKILWYCDIFDMITAGRAGRSQTTGKTDQTDSPTKP